MTYTQVVCCSVSLPEPQAVWVTRFVTGLGGQFYLSLWKGISLLISLSSLIFIWIIIKEVESLGSYMRVCIHVSDITEIQYHTSCFLSKCCGLHLISCWPPQFIWIFRRTKGQQQKQIMSKLLHKNMFFCEYVMMIHGLSNKCVGTQS